MMFLQENQCWYCRRQLTMRSAILQETPTIDHMTPLTMGGEPFGDNIVVACWRCNHLKGPLDAETFQKTQHDSRARKAAVVAANLAATKRAASRRPETQAEREMRGRIARSSRDRLWKKVYRVIDEQRGDRSIREWFTYIGQDECLAQPIKLVMDFGISKRDHCNDPSIFSAR
jgi:hypothetical protein